MAEQQPPGPLGRVSSSGPRSVPEIREAIALFESWEAGITDPAAAGRFAEAVQLLDDYLDVEPDSPHRRFVQNLKVSNTRRLLQLLKQVDKSDVSSWMEYVHAVALVLGEEAAALMTQHPELKKDFDAFIAVWGSQYVEALKKAGRSTSG
jgi:hypothetical protein